MGTKGAAASPNRHAKECRMSEQDASATTGPNDDGLAPSASGGSASLCGDPALELFGNGWAPKGGPAGNTGYEGRHRAPDA
jgi:hypothetical protein